MKRRVPQVASQFEICLVGGFFQHPLGDLRPGSSSHGGLEDDGFSEFPFQVDFRLIFFKGTPETNSKFAHEN